MGNDNDEDTSVTNDTEQDYSDGPAQLDGSGEWLDTDGTADDSIPGYGQIDALINDAKGLGDEAVASGLTDAAFQVTDLAGNIGSLLLDPVGWLVGAGIGILIDFVQPLEDAIGMVTGNPERMDEEIKKWGRVRAAMAPMTAEVRATAADGLASWTGDAAAIGKRRIGQLADAIDNVNRQMAYLEAILGLTKAVSSALLDLVKSEVSSWVTQTIFDFVVADALAVETFGASLATFLTETLARFGITSIRIVNFINKAVGIFTRILKICMKVSEILEKNARAFAIFKNILPAAVSAEEKTAGSADDPMSDSEVSAAMA